MASELIPGEVPVLRTCKPDGTSHGGFRWPLTVGAIVEAPDWNPKPTCGGGLHGLLRGEGNGSLLDWTEHAAWMVVAVAEVVDLVGKVKFPRCRVLHAGDRASATSLLDRLAPGAAIVGVSRIGGDRSTLTGGYRSTLTGGGDYSTLTGGDYSTLTGGYRSTLTGGYGSTLTGGDYSTLTGGDYSTLTGGYRSTLTGGYGSTLTGGYRSTLTGGDRSTLTGGYRSTLTGGDYSTLTGGDYSTLTGGGGSTLTGGYGSTLTGGDYSTLTGGDGSTLTGGDGSTLIGRRWDGNCTRIAVAYVGEDGIKPGVAYRVEGGKFVEARDGE